VISTKPIDTLGRLFFLQSCSLTRYVVNASPYVAPGDDHLLERLQAVAAEQQRMAGRLAETVLARRGRLPRVVFPMRYTSVHDLELRHLIGRIVQEHRAVVKEIEAAVTAFADDAELQQLASEMRSVATAHLALLEELASSDRPLELASRFERVGAENGSGAARRILDQKSPFVMTAA
jgi:hypothetical protein